MPQPPEGDGQAQQPDLDELRETSSNDVAAAAERDVGSIDGRKQKRAISRIDREDKMEGHLHNLLVTGLWVAGLAVLGVFLSIVWNIAAPHHWRYLETTEVDTLKTFVFSGAIGSAITAAGKKVVGKKGSVDADEN